MDLELCETEEEMNVDQPGWVKVNGRIVAATKHVNGSVSYRWLSKNRTADSVTYRTFSYARDCE